MNSTLISGARPNPWLDYDLSDRDGEEWRDVTAYDGIYQVSNHGRVKSLPRLDCRGKPLKEAIRRVNLRQTGSQVQFFEDRHYKHYSVMQLVGEAFLPRKAPTHVWAHRNKNGLDNRADNICAMTPQESKRLNIKLGVTPVPPRRKARLSYETV